MIRPIAIGLSPNVEVDDISLALKNIILLGFISRNESILTKLKNWFHTRFGFIYSFPLNSGRSGLMLALKSLKVTKDDEVIIPSFTCVAVPNSVLWVGAKPIYVEIDRETLNYNLSELKKKISSKTKAVIYQYTFGIPGPINEVRDLCKKKRIVLIEDLAHSIGSSYKGKMLGTYGDISVFSFGRDKAVSSVFGGLVAINNKTLADNFSLEFSKLSTSSLPWALKQYIHVISMLIILPTYNIEIGKFILLLLQKFNLVNKPVFNEEKSGRKPSVFPEKLHPSLALLALHQLNKIDTFNRTRQNYSDKYSKEFNTPYYSKYPLLRYPLLVEKRDEILFEFKKKGIILGNWYHNCIDPKGVDFSKVGYTPDVKTRYISDHIINLPTYPTFSEDDYKKVMSLIRKYKVKAI